jgi:pilus assembly protein TadC
VTAPGPAFLIGLILMGARRLTVLRRHRRRERTDVVEADRLAQILIVCLTGGMSVHSSLELAMTELRGKARRELERILRSAHREGLAVALAAAGSGIGTLMARIAHAQISGAGVVGAVAAHLDEARSRRRAEAAERARTLPVKLMLPLGLLILPGFILLFAGPLVMVSFGELLGGLP